jgi:hypothetical protein
MNNRILKGGGGGGTSIEVFGVVAVKLQQLPKIVLAIKRILVQLRYLSGTCT